MLLLSDLERFCAEKDLATAHEEKYRRSIRFLGQFLKHPPTRADLAEQKINGWLRSVSRDRSPATVRNHRAAITALWNWLADQDLVRPYDPRRLRRVRVCPPPPRSWTVAQVRQLLAIADRLPGQLRCGIKAADLMRGVIILAYASGLRLGDLCRLQRVDLVDGRLAITQHKTKHPHTIALSPETVASLRPLLAIDSPLVIPVTRRTLRSWTERLFRHAEAAGFHRQPGQSLGMLRKTGATEVARAGGLESAARFLGHKTGTDIARRYANAATNHNQRGQVMTITEQTETVVSKLLDRIEQSDSPDGIMRLASAIQQLRTAEVKAARARRFNIEIESAADAD